MKRFAKNPLKPHNGHRENSECAITFICQSTMLSAALLGIALVATPASAQKKYDTGATDTEIKIGNTIAYSGPASSYGVIAKAETAYFNKVNAEGGINGRKINFISYDDAYSPPKTVEQIRKLVEGDEVLFTFNTLGTPPNTAIQGYMNKKGVPQLFVGTGATKWGDPEHFPWTMGWQPTYQAEGRIYAKYILQNVQNPKIAIMYQNDDYGKDYVKGLKDGLGDKAKSLIVAEDSYETSEPTIDSHIVKLAGIGRQRVLRCFHRQVLGAGDQEGPRTRLEAAAYPEWCLDLDRRGDEAGRPRRLARCRLVRVSDGSDRPAVEGQPRHEGVGRLHGQVESQRRQDRRFQRLWLQPGTDDGAGSEAMR